MENKKIRVKHCVDYHDYILEEATNEAQWNTYCTIDQEEINKLIDILKTKKIGYVYRTYQEKYYLGIWERIELSEKIIEEL